MAYTFAFQKENMRGRVGLMHLSLVPASGIRNLKIMQGLDYLIIMASETTKEMSLEHTLLTPS